MDAAWSIGVPAGTGMNASQDVGHAQVLIIDEISMVSGELFEHLEHITKQVRGGEEPFGGLQIVLCGDYFQ